MTLFAGIVLFFAAMLGAALNSVAGGGSFITFPALLFAGVPPVMANATSTVALWPASLASAAAYRKEIGEQRSLLGVLGATSLGGGLIGSLLLLRTSDSVFVAMVPWLLLAATVLFTFGGAITSRLVTRTHEGGRGALVVAAALQLVIAVYGGFFGGGMSIMILAMLSLLGMTSIHAMNGLKTLLGTLINCVAVVTFVVARAVSWEHALVMVVGATVGGYFGAAIARQIEPRKVKKLVLVVAWGMTIYFLGKTYLLT